MQETLDVSNAVAAELAGISDGVLDALNERLKCHVRLRGNQLTLEGDDSQVAEATLHARAVRVHATHGGRRECLPRLARGLLLDPRAVGNEILRALPALSRLAGWLVAAGLRSRRS